MNRTNCHFFLLVDDFNLFVCNGCLAHYRAVWHCYKSYPHSWQLDPTEGPSRIRKRLQRCHLGISSKFLRDKHKYKLGIFPYNFIFILTYFLHLPTLVITGKKLHADRNSSHNCVCVFGGGEGRWLFIAAIMSWKESIN